MLEPLGKRVIILPDEAPKESPGGIYLPEGAGGQPVKGTILAVGAACETSIEKGDRVQFNKYAGAVLEHEGQQLLVMFEGDVILKYAK